MDAIAGLYALIICADGHVPCEYQLPAEKSLTRQECVERLQVIRWRQPHLRVVCITPYGGPYRQDVVDSAGILKPSREGNRMDMQGMPD